MHHGATHILNCESGDEKATHIHGHGAKISWSHAHTIFGNTTHNIRKYYIAKSCWLFPSSFERQTETAWARWKTTFKSSEWKAKKKKSREWYLNRSLISVDVNIGRLCYIKNFFVCPITAGTSSAVAEFASVNFLLALECTIQHWCNAMVQSIQVRAKHCQWILRNYLCVEGVRDVAYIFICCTSCEYRRTKKTPDTRQPRRRSQSSNKRNSCVLCVSIEIARVFSCCWLFWFVSQLYFPLVVVVAFFYYYCCAALAQFVRDAFVLSYNFKLNNGFLCKHL